MHLISSHAEAYQSIGTHTAIAMRPDDDVKLGKILKKAGYRQEMVLDGEASNRRMVFVDWAS